MTSGNVSSLGIAAPTRLMSLRRLPHFSPCRAMLAIVAKSLGAAGHSSEAVAGFLTRCLFSPQLDGRYTKDQRRALEHELRVEDGVIRLPRRAEFEFLRRFGDVAASADAVWPPIKRLTRE